MNCRPGKLNLLTAQLGAEGENFPRSQSCAILLETWQTLYTAYELFLTTSLILLTSYTVAFALRNINFANCAIYTLISWPELTLSLRQERAGLTWHLLPVRVAA